MKTKFIIDGSSVHIFKMNEDQFSDTLDPKIYTVQHNPQQGFYLEVSSDKLELPTKIYGITPNRVQKCVDTYKDRSMSTGILMTGDKGTGKTLLMSLLANEVIDQLKLPVLLIKSAYSGSQFVSFIESIGECCIVFDEFGKMYSSADRHHNEGEVPQKALLTLLDGVDKTKRMFIMTENSELDINDFMLNRPSRIYYHFKYDKLDEASVVGYCEDYGISNKVTKDIIDLSRRSKIFSFDMLQSIVEEHLRFNVNINETTSDLNIDIRKERSALIKIIKIIERSTEAEREVFETPYVTKPDSGYTYIKVAANHNARTEPTSDDIPQLRGSKSFDDEEDALYDEIYVREQDLAYEKEGNLVYETDKFTFVAKDVQTPETNYWGMF